MSWANAPAGTRSFFLHTHDLDLARNKNTDDQAHWVFWNIPATVASLPEGVPKGSQLADGSFQIGATGPMYRGPGAGANGPFHYYAFELYALDTMLEVKPSSDAFETRQCDEGDSGPCFGEGGIWRLVPAAAVIRPGPDSSLRREIRVVL
jgi:Raf kinase inhibitor-like YbhB/YbcL family protein